MTLQRIAGVCMWILVAPTVAAGQQRAGTAAPQPPASRIIELSYPSGALTPIRQTETRVASGGREIVTETVEMPGLSGTLEPIRQIVTETVRLGSNMTRTRQELFGVDADRRRSLLERTEADREVSAAGDSRLIETTWAADLNGGFNVKSRLIEVVRTIGRDNHESRTTLLVPDVNETLRENERTDVTQRSIGASVVRHNSTHMVRDLNGGWLPTETRVRDTRQQGSSDRLEEETVSRHDINGHAAVSERTITRRSAANGRDDVTIETFTPAAEGLTGSDTRLGLSRRVRTSTTAAADGGSRTVEEVEERNLVAPSDPLRVTRRAELTIRRTGRDRWTTERRVFELDVNGQMTATLTESQETAERPGNYR